MGEAGHFGKIHFMSCYFLLPASAKACAGKDNARTRWDGTLNASLNPLLSGISACNPVLNPVCLSTNATGTQSAFSLLRGVLS